MSTIRFLNEHHHFMGQAIRLARLAEQGGDVPVGALVVQRGQVLGTGYNQVEMLKDPTAHAEILAITAACNALGTKHLTDCTLYVTLEPCAMCAGAIVLARPERLVFGAIDEKAGASGSIFNITGHRSLNHRVQLLQGVREGECSDLLSDFFERRRQRGGGSEDL